MHAPIEKASNTFEYPEVAHKKSIVASDLKHFLMWKHCSESLAPVVISTA